MILKGTMNYTNREEIEVDGVNVAQCPDVIVFEDEGDYVGCDNYLSGVCAGNNCLYKKYEKEKIRSKKLGEALEDFLTSFHIAGIQDNATVPNAVKAGIEPAEKYAEQIVVAVPITLKKLLEAEELLNKKD